MASTDFHRALEGLSATAYSPHRFDFAMDLNPLLQALSPQARYFFLLATEALATDGGISPLQLCSRRWRDDPEVLSAFLDLTVPEQVEVLTLYTLPVHEMRHHIDFLTTSYGARFYTLLAQEYQAFQDCSPFLLQTQDVITPGPVGELSDRLASVDANVPSQWIGSWKAFRATTENLLSTVDTRGLEPDRSRAKDISNPPVYVAGIKFLPVSIFDRALSYRIESRPGWYMRASTLLEGRAVIQSLLWIIDSLGAENPAVNDLLRAYMSANYGSEAAYDYLFLLELTASWVGDSDFASMLRRPTVTVRSILHLTDNAAWFALNAGWVSGDRGAMHPENMFTRFLVGLKILEEAFDGAKKPPYELLAAAEDGSIARNFGLIPTPKALKSSLQLTEATRDRLSNMWQSSMAKHFEAILSVVSSALARRQPAGISFAAGAPADGNGVRALDDETFADLFRPYAPGRWVTEWFDFRNRCMFAPTTTKATLKYLRDQFGLAEVAVNCKCGVMLSRPAPRWRPDTTVTCPDCGRHYSLVASDMRVLHVPEDVESEFARLLDRTHENDNESVQGGERREDLGHG